MGLPADLLVGKLGCILCTLNRAGGSQTENPRQVEIRKGGSSMKTNIVAECIIICVSLPFIGRVCRHDQRDGHSQPW